MADNKRKIRKINTNHKIISNVSELQGFSANKNIVDNDENENIELESDIFEEDSFEIDTFQEEKVNVASEADAAEKQQNKKVVPVSFENADDMKISYDKAAVKKKRGKKPSKMDRVFFLITQSILMAILFFTIGMLTNKMHSYVSEDALDKQLLNEFGISFATMDPSGNTDEDSKDVPAYPVETPPRYKYPEGPTLAQLTAMKEKNSDFVCLLYIPSTMIEPITYPVLQAHDNDFYLYKDFNKNYKRSGSLFLDFRNNAETLEGHSIIYGHNMHDGSMFGNVLKYYQYEDGSFLKKHQYIYTYSLSGVDVWKVFSVYETTTDENYIQTHFASEDEYYQFIKDLHNKSFFDTDVILKATDDVLTLSTCYKFNAANGRLVVNAVRVGSSILN